MFRAVRDYDGSDTDKCISLQTGDLLSAVHALDDTWFIGHNDRSETTGAFPINCVEEHINERDNIYTPMPGSHAESVRTDEPREKPKYANVSQQIQEQQSKKEYSEGHDPLEIAKILSKKANKFDALRFLSTKPEKTYRIKLVKQDDEENESSDKADTVHTDVSDAAVADGDQGTDVSSEYIFSKEATLGRSVKFDDYVIERSLSVPESTTSWHDSTFEHSFTDESIEIDRKHAEEVTKGGPGTYHRLEIPSIDTVKAGGKKLFMSDRGENKQLKAIFGAISGIVIGGLLFIVLVFSFGYSALEAGIIDIVATIIISVALALSSLCRCILALVFPNFFTGKGRTVFLSIIFGVILSNPIANITHNARETGNSMACIAELAMNQTQALQRQLAQPAKEVSAYIVKQKQYLEQSSKSINDAFKAAKDELDKIDSHIDTAKSTLFDMRKQCKDPITKIVNDCNNNCAGIITNPFCLSACKSLLTVTTACDQLTGLETNLTAIANNTRQKIDEAIRYFTVQIVVDVDFSGETNRSVNTSEIQKEINEDISAKSRGFRVFANVVKKFLSLSLAIIFFQAFWYIRNYLAKDDYDNIYVTKQLRELDAQAGENGRPTILPLKSKEDDVYVDTSSFKLNSTERGYCKIGLAQVILHVILCTTILIFDHSLYYILNIVRRFSDVTVEASGQGRVNIEVVGNGPVADFYKIMVQGINLDQRYVASLELGVCMPNPSTPSVSVIPVLIIMYMIALCFVFLRGYGMRLRRKISAYYYPEQEIVRLEYLHKKIRHKRVGFLKFLRQQIKSSHKESVVKEKLHLSTWLRFHFPMIGRLLPSKEELQCLCCERKESSFNDIQLTKCKGDVADTQCEAVYCQECRQALNNTCPLCTQDEVVLRE